MLIRSMLAVLFLGSFLIAGEADPDPKVAPGKADIRGTVTRAQPQAGKFVGSVLIEGKKEKDTNFDKAAVRVTKETKIERLVKGARKAANFADLKPGTKVQADFTGPVAESYPVQATASSILILE